MRKDLSKQKSSFIADPKDLAILKYIKASKCRHPYSKNKSHISRRHLDASNLDFSVDREFILNDDITTYASPHSIMICNNIKPNNKRERSKKHKKDIKKNDNKIDNAGKEVSHSLNDIDADDINIGYHQNTQLSDSQMTWKQIRDICRQIDMNCSRQARSVAHSKSTATLETLTEQPDKEDPEAPQNDEQQEAIQTTVPGYLSEFPSLTAEPIATDSFIDDFCLVPSVDAWCMA